MDVFSSQHNCNQSDLIQVLIQQMAMAQQAVRRRRHPMSVRRRRHTHTSCNYYSHILFVLKCRREACYNDSPRGGPLAGRPSLTIQQDGPSARINDFLHYSTAGEPKFLPSGHSQNSGRQQ